MAELAVFNNKGEKVDTINVPDEIFGARVNKEVLHQAIVMYQACLRQGTAETKERNDVSGGGKKPWRQKGTGRARAGSTRSPLWVGGGVVFGPHPRDYSYSIPKKAKKVALRESLNSKFQDKDLVCVTDFKESFDKTKQFATILKALKLKGKIVAILDGSNPSVVKVSRNIGRFELMEAKDINAYDILRHKKLLVTKTAFEALLNRIQKDATKK